MVAQYRVLARHPSLQVCKVAVRGQDLLAGDEVVHFDAVSNGIDIGIRRPHVFVDGDTSCLSDLNARFFRKLCVGSHSYGHDGELAGKLRPVAELDGRELAVLAQEGCEAVPGYHVGVLAFHVVLDELCHFPVKEGKELGQEFHHGDLYSGKLEGLACFNADQTPADNDGLLDLPFVPDLSEVVGITHRLQGGYTRKLCAGDGGKPGDRTCCDDEFVIFDRCHLI
ncbi:MAG: hypothetical protein A4E61_00505 [Syntrophorhabdus sp. PtaB.Bin184]|nr:MAG: hypothetical protein A4E61_00505 [Syntrophorhabdus sp. PtaB.Bin184]